MTDFVFDLEQKIFECWHVTEDIEMVTSWFTDSPEWEGMDPKVQDAMMNKYLAIKELYDMRFSKLWSTFENHAKQYHFYRRACTE